MITKQVNVSASQFHDTLNISLDISQEDWDNLSETEQQELIQNEIDNDHNQPYWIVD